MFTIEQFRKDFPEFSDNCVYTNDMVTYWATLGAKLICESRWGNVYNDGMNLFVAHNITLQVQDVKAAAGGGIPGTSSGATSSKSVGQASKSYDTANSSIKGGGEYNATSYGRRYLRLVKMFGAGGLHV